MANKRRVMGIDPGLTRLGFGVVESRSGKFEEIAQGTIVTQPGPDTALRLSRLFEELSSRLAEYKPASVAIERVFFNLNARTVVPVIQSAGVAMLAASKAGLEVLEYTPQQVKEAVVGTGKASKEQVRYMVGKLLRIAEPKGADAADALAVAVCHLNSAKLAALTKGAK